nr:unnamed protein product [Digitaria exilis]
MATRPPPEGKPWELAAHPRLAKGKVVGVVVLDGWGEAPPDPFNYIHVAETPTLDALKKGAPERWRLIKAHGTAVGLPTDDDMGNSEVGHNALGAGQIYAQGAKLVDLALSSGKIYEGEGFKYIQQSFENGTLHLIGLLSDGGVHSRFDQLQLLLKGASEHGAKRIRVHVLTDGRDVLDGSSVRFVEMLEEDLSRLRDKGVNARIASGGGRMYVTMDRYENDWQVVKRGWDAHVLGEAPHKFKSALEAVKKLREDPKANDQYLPPFVIVDESGKPVGPVQDGDTVVTFNFRADRMVMLAKALEYENFDKFDRVRFPKIRYAGMLQYDGELKLPSHYLVAPPQIERTSGEYLARNGVRIYACRVNIANGDMVGHTGDIEATIVGCKATDEAVKIILEAIEQVGGIFILTADHGNAEDMAKRDKSGKPLRDKDGKVQTLTSHTLNPVPIAIGGPGLAPGVRFRKDLPCTGLANVAATVMNLHGFEAPDHYEPTLIEVVGN